ncbi:MAG: DUF4249 domain-containing protein, partial [Muribaculaceae bacterium]|nr:DUF4249 domain-containing protein [Muribaculaceae bacterium]
AIFRIAFLFIGLLLAGCEKELDFKYHDIEPILVIEGSLTQTGAEVSLTLTTPMDEPMNREHLTDAEVMIADLTSGADFALAPDSEGVFISDVPGIEGHSYRLTVKRGGEVYISESIMGAEVDITAMEFNWIKMPYDYVAVLQVSFTDNPLSNDDCYWLRVYRNGEAYKWAEINDMLSANGIINEVMMTTRMDLDEEDEGDKLEDGDVIKATVVPVSREMYDYLEALSVGNSNGPRMFEGGFCLGYFLAAPITAKEVIFRPEEIKYF